MIHSSLLFLVLTFSLFHLSMKDENELAYFLLLSYFLLISSLYCPSLFEDRRWRVSAIGTSHLADFVGISALRCCNSCDSSFSDTTSQTSTLVHYTEYNIFVRQFPSRFSLYYSLAMDFLGFSRSERRMNNTLRPEYSAYICML